jgi:phosphinothricin acetyltransferase
VSATVRPAAAADAAAVAAIHNEGIAERVATFRSEPRSVAAVEAAIASESPFLVAERDGAIVGWANVGPYDDAADWYAGIGEAGVYVLGEARGSGVGRELLAALERAAEEDGLHKLIAKIFTTNEPSLKLFEESGYERVGVHRRHGRLDGEWKDVVVLERPLGDAAA